MTVRYKLFQTVGGFCRSKVTQVLKGLSTLNRLIWITQLKGVAFGHAFQTAVVGYVFEKIEIKGHASVEGTLKCHVKQAEFDCNF